MRLEKRVDWKQQYRIDPTDGLLRTSLADYDLFPNIKKLLVIDCISPIGFAEGDSSVLCTYPGLPFYIYPLPINIKTR